MRDGAPSRRYCYDARYRPSRDRTPHRSWGRSPSPSSASSAPSRVIMIIIMLLLLLHCEGRSDTASPSSAAACRRRLPRTARRGRGVCSAGSSRGARPRTWRASDSWPTSPNGPPSPSGPPRTNAPSPPSSAAPTPPTPTTAPEQRPRRRCSRRASPRSSRSASRTSARGASAPPPSTASRGTSNGRSSRGFRGGATTSIRARPRRAWGRCIWGGCSMPSSHSRREGRRRGCATMRTRWGGAYPASPRVPRDVPRCWRGTRAPCRRWCERACPSRSFPIATTTRMWRP
mmetsp:Transcript_3127/g.7952  ORF Transcript_3127/g.7952 Transcript_3127/m.7952 type:complete len:288 (+) Transcript_3127:3076-3939(+)